MGIRFYIFPDIPVDIIRVIFNFRFSTRKCQSQQKLPKKITHFPIQFLKTSLVLQTSAHLTLKIICSRNTAKKISSFTNFPVKMFLSGVKKDIALQYFLTPKNCTLEALWKQMSVYFFISSSENFCSRHAVRFYLVEGGIRNGAE